MIMALELLAQSSSSNVLLTEALQSRESKCFEQCHRLSSFSRFNSSLYPAYHLRWFDSSFAVFSKVVNHLTSSLLVCWGISLIMVTPASVLYSVWLILSSAKVRFSPIEYGYFSKIHLEEMVDICLQIFSVLSQWHCQGNSCVISTGLSSRPRPAARHLSWCRRRQEQQHSNGYKHLK